MKRSGGSLAISQIKAWAVVLAVACAIYIIIHLGQSALGLDFLFHDKLAVDDERRSWVWALVLFPFVVVLGLFLFGTAMSRMTKIFTLQSRLLPSFVFERNFRL